MDVSVCEPSDGWRAGDVPVRSVLAVVEDVADEVEVLVFLMHSCR